MSDAIGRTLYRLLVSRRSLLEWRTAAQAQVSERLDLAGFYRHMAGAVVIGAAVIGLAIAGQANALLAVPFGLLWILSPVLARHVSRPSRVARQPPLSDVDVRALRLIARRAWSYFDTFVTDADHMLPPDNFQEDPRPMLAHRTSPTNLGLYLLSIVTARDFGWAGTLDTVERLEATLACDGPAGAIPRALLQLVRHQGPAAARAAVRLVRRQRQPRGPPDHAGECLRRDGDAAGAGTALSRRHRATASRCCASRCARPPTSSSTRRSTRSPSSWASAPAAPAELAGHLAELATRAAAVTQRTVALAHERAGRGERGSGCLGRVHAAGRSRAISATWSRPRTGGTEALAQRLDALATTARAMAAAMRFDFLLRSGAQAALDRLPRAGGHSRPELLRPARVRGPPRELRRDRERRPARASLVPPRTRGDSRSSTAPRSSRGRDRCSST